MNNMPEIGFGTWKLKETKETTQIILSALDAGYRFFDTASSYQNESPIGAAIKDTVVSRDELFISGKLWNTDRENVREACLRTIENLNCRYLDLYLVHWPASKAVHDDWAEIDNCVWKQMEDILKEGLVKRIGVSNFKVCQLKPLLDRATVKPFVNQIEIHPGYMQQDIVEYCRGEGIAIQAWSPLGSGRLMKKAVITDIADKYHKSPAQICIRWCVQNGIMPIVKSKNSERMRSNLEIFDFEITPDDMEYMNSLTYICSSGLDSETLTLFG